MEEAMTKSHFYYKCNKIVNPIKKFEIVCPFCQSEFIEELEYTARDYDSDGQLVIFLYCKGRCSPKEDAFLDLVLPGYRHGHGPDSVCTAEHKESKQAEADPYSPRCYQEPEEVPEPGLFSTDQPSPPYSPSNSDSSLSTPFALEYEEVNFKVKEEDR